jgi:hypothetical protein
MRIVVGIVPIEELIEKETGREVKVNMQASITPEITNAQNFTWMISTHQLPGGDLS